MTTPIVLISGLKNSGKNTFGEMFVEEYHNFSDYLPEEIAFADPIKEAAHLILGISRDVLWGNSALKESTFCYGKSVRQILQWMGTEVFRDNISNDVWVDATIRRIIRERDYESATPAWVVTDCRFPNEYVRCKAVLEEGAPFEDNGSVVSVAPNRFRCFLVKVTRSSALAANDQHRSETEVSKLDAFNPVVVANDGTLDQLRARAASVAAFVRDAVKT